MLHLSRFLIGVRHRRTFKIRDRAGSIVDAIARRHGDSFNKVNMARNNEETALFHEASGLQVLFNKDDVIVEQAKKYDDEQKLDNEIKKENVVALAQDCLHVATTVLELGDDYSRIGMILEFRIPAWGGIQGHQFGRFIKDRFIAFDVTGEVGSGLASFSYKLGVPGGGIERKFLDYRNVIVRVEEGSGLNEENEEEKCLLIASDIQHYFDPMRREVKVNEHFEFSEDHLNRVLLPAFGSKGVKIEW